MSDTKIEWADKVWNPLHGCTPISEGCAHCYARSMARRLAGMNKALHPDKDNGYDPDDPFGVRLCHTKLDQPLRWRDPRRVFVCSMGDLFHEDVPFDFIRAVISRMLPMGCVGWTKHIFMILTKRQKRMRDFFLWMDCQMDFRIKWPLPNVWLGVSVENQARADERIPVLLDTPAAVRFISAEPLLGPISLKTHLQPRPGATPDYVLSMEHIEMLDWVIAGGETGPGARECRESWLASIFGQCRKAGIPYFFKHEGKRFVREYVISPYSASAGVPNWFNTREFPKGG